MSPISPCFVGGIEADRVQCCPNGHPMTKVGKIILSDGFCCSGCGQGILLGVEYSYNCQICNLSHEDKGLQFSLCKDCCEIQKKKAHNVRAVHVDEGTCNICCGSVAGRAQKCKNCDFTVCTECYLERGAKRTRRAKLKSEIKQAPRDWMVPIHRMNKRYDRIVNGTKPRKSPKSSPEEFRFITGPTAQRLIGHDLVNADNIIGPDGESISSKIKRRKRRKHSPDSSAEGWKIAVSEADGSSNAKWDLGISEPPSASAEPVSEAGWDVEMSEHGPSEAPTESVSEQAWDVKVDGDAESSVADVPKVFAGFFGNDMPKSDGASSNPPQAMKSFFGTPDYDAASTTMSVDAGKDKLVVPSVGSTGTKRRRKRRKRSKSNPGSTTLDSSISDAPVAFKSWFDKGSEAPDAKSETASRASTGSKKRRRRRKKKTATPSDSSLATSDAPKAFKSWFDTPASERFSQSPAPAEDMLSRHSSCMASIPETATTAVSDAPEAFHSWFDTPVAGTDAKSVSSKKRRKRKKKVKNASDSCSSAMAAAEVPPAFSTFFDEASNIPATENEPRESGNTKKSKKRRKKKKKNRVSQHSDGEAP